MNLIERAKAMLLAPAQTWPVIDAEPATPASIYKDWLVVMAAIPAVCGFVGMSIVGSGMFGYSYRMPIVYGLMRALLQYGGTLLMVFLVALIVDALAPTFGGSKNRISALKLVAFGSTASFVAGLLSLLPALGALAALVAFVYSLYVIYLGLPVLMKCPQDKAAGYLAVTAVIAIVVGLVLGAVMSPFMMGAAWMGGRHGSAFSISTPDGEVSVDGDSMQRAAARMDAARERMEAAQKSGDPASAGQALGDLDVVVVLEVEGDRSLVAVDPEVVGRDTVAHRRLPGAGVVPSRRLDLDDLRAEVREQHRGVGTGQDPREVGDQQPGERSGRSVGHAFHLCWISDRCPVSLGLGRLPRQDP